MLGFLYYQFPVRSRLRGFTAPYAGRAGCFDQDLVFADRPERVSGYYKCVLPLLQGTLATTESLNWVQIHIATLAAVQTSQG